MSIEMACQDKVIDLKPTEAIAGRLLSVSVWVVWFDKTSWYRRNSPLIEGHSQASISVQGRSF